MIKKSILHCIFVRKKNRFRTVLSQFQMQGDHGIKIWQTTLRVNIPCIHFETKAKTYVKPSNVQCTAILIFKIAFLYYLSSR